MAGFTGTIRLDPENGESLLTVASETSIHPHFSGFTDPVTSPPVHMVATSCLANKSSLLSKLDMDAGSDSEVLIAGWKAWGKDLATHLEGSFAFVLWDDDKQVGFATVDRFGSTPIHYHKGHESLTVSTDLRPLAEIPEIREDIDRIMIAEYLLSIGDGPALANQTFFTGIKRLPAGHTLTFSSDGVRLNRYHTIATPPFDMDEDTTVSTFRKLLNDSVDRCQGTERAAVLLSGGLDSSTVAALARTDSEVIPALHFHSPQDNESDWAKAVVEEGGLQLEQVECQGFMDTVDDMLSAMAEPWAYDNLHHDFLLLRRGGELGCETVLGGYYGDVTVCGTLDYLKPWADKGDWTGFHEECQKASEVQGTPAETYLWYHGGARFDDMAKGGRWMTLWKELRTVSKIFSVPFKVLAWHFWLRPFAPRPLRRLFRIVTGAERPVWWEMNRQLNTGFADDMELNQRAKRMKGAWMTPLKDAVETHENLIYHDSTAVTLAHLFALAQASNTVAMHPFMDDALVRFCLSLPRTYHGREGWDRWITREAMKGCLTETVRLRQGRTHYAATAFAELKNDVDEIDAFVETWPGTLDEFIDKDIFLSDWTWLKEEAELSPEVAAVGRRLRRTILLGKWLMIYG